MREAGQRVKDATQALTAAIATRICYSSGYDAKDPEVKHVIDRMVARGYRNQVLKAGSVKSSASVFHAARGRVDWSQKLRDDHRLMVAVETLLESVGDGRRVPVRSARLGMPVISIFAGAATNSHMLGGTVAQVRHHGATLALAGKYGLTMPENLSRSAHEE